MPFLLSTHHGLLSDLSDVVLFEFEEALFLGHRLITPIQPDQKQLVLLDKL
jgi:hypothetical protein